MPPLPPFPPVDEDPSLEFGTTAARPLVRVPALKCRRDRGAAVVAGAAVAAAAAAWLVYPSESPPAPSSLPGGLDASLLLLLSCWRATEPGHCQLLLPSAVLPSRSAVADAVVTAGAFTCRCAGGLHRCCCCPRCRRCPLLLTICRSPLTLPLLPETLLICADRIVTVAAVGGCLVVDIELLEAASIADRIVCGRVRRSAVATCCWRDSLLAAAAFTAVAADGGGLLVWRCCRCCRRAASRPISVVASRCSRRRVRGQASPPRSPLAPSRWWLVVGDPPPFRCCCCQLPNAGGVLPVVACCFAVSALPEVAAEQAAERSCPAVIAVETWCLYCVPRCCYSSLLLLLLE